MPTPSQMQLPKSKSADEFENICCDVLSALYNIRFQQYGRKGQQQNGIDLYANNFSKVAQCKNYFKPANIENKIKSDYKNAMAKFKPQEFIVMTALDRDTSIQNQILQIGENISILFWEDIQETICANSELFTKYYPNLNLNNNYISPTRINKIIRDLFILRDNANSLHIDFSNYKPAYDEERDRYVYNICASMFIHAEKLYKKLFKCYIQLNQYSNLGTRIEQIIRSLPDVHDAHNGYVEMICTIQDFLSYYNNHDKYNQFISECQYAIDTIQRNAKLLTNY